MKQRKRDTEEKHKSTTRPRHCGKKTEKMITRQRHCRKRHCARDLCFFSRTGQSRWIAAVSSPIGCSQTWCCCRDASHGPNSRLPPVVVCFTKKRGCITTETTAPKNSPNSAESRLKTPKRPPQRCCKINALPRLTVTSSTLHFRYAFANPLTTFATSFRWSSLYSLALGNTM